jgi:hypothetical protein
MPAPSSHTSKTGVATGARERNTRKRALAAVRVRGTTLSFTAPNVIADSADGFTAAKGFGAGRKLEVRGSALNSGKYAVVSRADGLLTVIPQLIRDEAAGATVTVTQR